MTPTTSSQPPPSADTERAASRGARVALLAFLALCSLFVLSSTWQLLQGALYGATAPAASDERRIDPRGPCAGHLRRLAAAVDRGLAVATAAPSDDAALELFRGGLAPDWANRGAAVAACAPEPGGPDAFAAVDRLREAGEAVSRRTGGDLASARRDVAAVLPR